MHECIRLYRSGTVVTERVTGDILEGWIRRMESRHPEAALIVDGEIRSRGECDEGLLKQYGK